MPRRTEVEEGAAMDMVHWLDPSAREAAAARIRTAVQSGEKLVLEESLFSDPGADYSALYVGDDKTSLVYVPGY